MYWFLFALKKYADLNGRARRKECWGFHLINLLLIVIATLIYILLDSIIFIAVYLPMVILPSLAVTIRRLHDLGKSGMMLFLLLIPVLGTVWLLMLLMKEGHHYENLYGPDRKRCAYNKYKYL
jgi:uncharacterized membrane protein YhaH (DUF805 family)